MADTADEKAAVAANLANEDLAAKYPAPPEPVAVAAEAPANSFEPAVAAAYPAPVSMSDAPQPAGTTVVVVAPPADNPLKRSYTYVAPPNKYMSWFVSGGPTNGLCIGYATLSLIAFIAMCIAASANGTWYVSFGWQIFNGLQGWLYAGVLAVMFGYKPAYVAIMSVWGNTDRNVVQWVWILINIIEWVFWTAAMANAASWNYCSDGYWWGGSANSACGKIQGTLAMDVFGWLGWSASLTFALMERFAPKLTGTVGWQPEKAAEAPAEKPGVVMATLEASDPVTQV
ncbi:hypothetical protein DFJ74DRAFT_665056 [Hyaloraphidium curvatum]|nr:hypothetical protein DFJ74DRAFT_665056 [Hyaloraphidium curvatum]